MNKVVSGVAFNYVIIFSTCVIYIIFSTDLITGLFSFISSSIFYHILKLNVSLF